MEVESANTPLNLEYSHSFSYTNNKTTQEIYPENLRINILNDNILISCN